MAGSNILMMWDATLDGGKGDYRSLTVDDLVAASGSASDPSIVQTTNGVTAAQIATETTLQQIRDQGKAIAPVEPTEHTVTAVAEPLPTLATPNGFRIQVPDAGSNIYVRANAGVTITGVNRGWEVPAGTSRFFNWTTTTGVHAISTGSVEVLIEVEP